MLLSCLGFDWHLSHLMLALQHALGRIASSATYRNKGVQSTDGCHIVLGDLRIRMSLPGTFEKIGLLAWLVQASHVW